MPIQISYLRLGFNYKLIKCYQLQEPTMVSESEMKCISNSKSFGGYQKVYEHFR